MASLELQVAKLVQVLQRYFVGVIVASYGVAVVWPGFGVWIRQASLGKFTLGPGELELSLLPLLLAALLFNAGLGVKTEELKELRGQSRVLLAGLFGNIATPLVFILVLSFAMRGWPEPEEVEQILVGLALVAAMPIAGASTAWAQNANGNLALSLGLVLITTLLSPLLTPLILKTVGGVTTGDYAEHLHELASATVVSFLGTWVILPSLLGMLAHRGIGDQRLAEAKPYVKLSNYGVLVLLNYSNASLTLPRVAAHPDPDFLLIILGVVTALCLAGFASGYLLARFLRTGRRERVSLMFGLGMNNNGTGLVLASLALTGHPGVMLPIIFYNLVQHLVASVVNTTLFQSPPTPR
jgi:BASS family bile acid:Na+ symporter